MKLAEAKKKFIESWANQSGSWGIPRAVAQVHALLLMNREPVNTEQVMAELGISRGGANTALRMLVEWGLAERKLKKGSRMEYFQGEKDVWKMAVRIIRQRKKRELDPVRESVRQLMDIDDRDEHSEEYGDFITLIRDIGEFTESADRISDKLLLSDKSWFLLYLMKMMS